MYTAIRCIILFKVHFYFIKHFYQLKLSQINASLKYQEFLLSKRIEFNSILCILFQGYIVPRYDRLSAAVGPERGHIVVIQGVPAFVDAAGPLGAYQLDRF